jgi:hypothetical protein
LNPSVSGRSRYLPNDLMPNTFMATTIDLGDALSPFGSVHCRYKTEVGERLAQAALKHAYVAYNYLPPAPASAQNVGREWSDHPVIRLESWT